MKTRASIIVAYNGKHVIGNNLGKVPWHIAEDLRFFKETTMGHPCIMGRKTWDSIPAKYKPLPGRFNIIVSRDHSVVDCGPPSEAWDSIAICSTVEHAVRFGKALDPKGEVFVTGGAQVYRYCLDHNLVDRVLASEIKNHLDVAGATFFPDLKELGWVGTVHREFADFTVMDYRKCHDRDQNDTRTAGAGSEARGTADEAIQEQPQVHPQG